jgi:phosphatidylinositol alpha-1,6-mannosyltransferase
MDQKTIIIPVYDFKPLLGGVANYVHELAVQFSRRAQVHVVSRNLPGMEAFDRDLPYRITRIAVPTSTLGSYPFFARALRSLMRQERPDVIFCPTWMPDGAAARSAIGSAGVPYFVAAHGMEVFDNFLNIRNGIRTVLTRKLKQAVFQEARKVFPVSNYTRQAVISQAGVAESSAFTVNNGVNPEIFKPLPGADQLREQYKPAGEKILLTVTRLYPYKGVDRMLEALPAIVRAIPGTRYMVAGTGPDQQRLQELSNRLGLQDHVTFLGPLPLEKIIELYNVADLFVMLSREALPDVEGFGLVFLEAAACGLPSVGGRSGGIPDAIEQGESGWLVDPCDTQEIAGTIIELLQSPEKLERAAAFCLSTAPRKTWAEAADRILGEMFERKPEGVLP